MNWFTKKFVSNKSLEQKASLVAEHDSCEHVTDNPETLYVIHSENDSFGSEGYCMCEACWDELQEQEGDNTHVCHDCKLSFKERDGVMWKWYDFYAAQGDEPLPICGTCKDAETHLRRCAADKAALVDEFPDIYND